MASNLEILASVNTEIDKIYKQSAGCNFPMETRHSVLYCCKYVQAWYMDFNFLYRILDHNVNPVSRIQIF